MAAVSNIRFHYMARVLRVVDGDTVQVELDLGCDVRQRMTLRLYGINTPELPSSEGVKAKEYLAGWLGDTCFVRTHKDKREKYGRYLAQLWADEAAFDRGDPSINARLVASSNAVVYLP